MKKLLFILSLFCASSAFASQNMLRSCYEIAGLAAPQPALQNTALFVLLDQTVVLDNKLKQLVVDNIRPFLRPGNSFYVASFSAYAQDRYAQVLTSGDLSVPMSKAQRDDTGEKTLKKFDQCLNLQQRAAAKLMSQALIGAFSASSDTLAKSDIISTLQELSQAVRSAHARGKVVLIVSDMLENSGISSFYQHAGVRKINPDTELKNVESHGLLANFAGAKIYVIGAGLLGRAAKQSYRDPAVMHALESFWTRYFTQSHAVIGEFGKPALFRPIQ